MLPAALDSRLMTRGPLLSPAAMRAVEQARSESFKEVLVAIARSRAKAELAQEARQRVQQNINRAPARRPDEFTPAARIDPRTVGKHQKSPLRDWEGKV